MSELKLYVWSEFAPDYPCGLAFAIAETVQEAQALVEKSSGITCDWGPVEEHKLDKIAFYVYGGMQ